MFDGAIEPQTIGVLDVTENRRHIGSYAWEQERWKEGRTCDQKAKVGTKHDRRAFLGIFFLGLWEKT